MAEDISSWSTTPADNDTADAGINWQENQAPSTVNNAARAMMTAVKKWWDSIVDGSFWASRDFIVDTDTLYVDTTDERVGINTAFPVAKLSISAANTEYTMDAYGMLELSVHFDTSTSSSWQDIVTFSGLGTYTLESVEVVGTANYGPAYTGGNIDSLWFWYRGGGAATVVKTRNDDGADGALAAQFVASGNDCKLQGRGYAAAASVIKLKIRLAGRGGSNIIVS